MSFDLSDLGNFMDKLSGGGSSGGNDSGDGDPQGTSNPLEKIPKESKTGFFPIKLKDPLVCITGTSLQKNTNLRTIVIGTITKQYTDEMFEMDLKEYIRHFQLEEDFFDEKNKNFVAVVKMKPLAKEEQQGPDMVDSREATEKLQVVIDHFNSLEPLTQWLRVVQMGVSHSNYFMQSVEYIVKEATFAEGKLDPDNPKEYPRQIKRIEFVTTGDSQDSGKQNMCKCLIIKGYADEVVFYNTRLYHPFGYFEAS